MKRFIMCCATVALILPVVPGTNAAYAAPSAGATQSQSSTAQVAAIAAKLDLLSEYVVTGNAASLAGLWTEDGSYVDDAGSAYQGRSALQKRFETGFAAGDKPKVALKPDRTQILAPTVAVSEGTILRKESNGEMVAGTRYSFVFTKKAGDWYISSATETPIESVAAAADTTATNAGLDNIAWMLGDWKAERDGTALKLHVDWAANKNFLLWTYQIGKPGAATTQENTEVIGFDPKRGELVSWSFDSTGSFGKSSWSKDASQWQLESVKTAKDGSTLTARTIITPKDNNSFTWQSVDRTAGGLPLPDTGELQITRDSK